MSLLLEKVPIVDANKTVVNYLYIRRLNAASDESPKILKVYNKEEGEKIIDSLKNLRMPNGSKQWELDKNLPKSKRIK